MTIQTRWHSPNPVRCAEWIPGDAESLADVTALLGRQPEVAEDGSFTFEGMEETVTVYPRWWLWEDEIGLGTSSSGVARTRWHTTPQAVRSSGSGL